MTLDELEIWREEYIRDPWGERRADIRSAMEQRTLAHYAGKSRKTQATLDEFLLKFRDPNEPEPMDDGVDPDMFFKQYEG